MVDQKIKTNQTDDFFRTIENEERIANPFDLGEVIFKDESGNIKVVNATTLAPLKTSPAGSQSTPTVKPAVNMVEPSHPKLDLGQEIAAVVKKSGIHFNDAELEQRFRGIVESRLRSVRSRTETREAFVGSILTGNMGFDSPHADKIMDIIDAVGQQFQDKNRQQVVVKPFSGLQAEAEALLKNAAVKIEEPKLPELHEPVVVFQPELKPEPTPELEYFRPVVVKPVVEIKPTPPPVTAAASAAPKTISLPRVTVRTNNDKPKVTDVKYRPKLTGPLEEIGNMTPTDFRRLGAEPEQAMQKILEKISLLEEESFSQKTAAIAVWKDSPINRLYLELGDKSMEEKIPITQVIEQFQQSGQPYLTEAEIHAVIELNRRLRY